MDGGQRYDAVFFDLYGTLVDIRTDEESLMTWDSLRRTLVGCGVDYDDGLALVERFGMLSASLRRDAVRDRGRWAEVDLLPAFVGLLDEVTGGEAVHTAVVSRETRFHSTDVSRETLIHTSNVSCETFRAGECVAADGSDPSAAMDMPGPTVTSVRSDTSDAAAVSALPDVPGSPSASAVERLAWAFRRASTRRLRCYPGATALLSSLREAGLRTILVSNAQSCFTRPELAMLGLDRALDRIVISSEEGIRKPSPDFFRIALEREGLDPSRVLMVGNDERCDIIGARSAGIDGAYLRTAISPSDDPSASDHAVASFDGPDYDGLLDFILRRA